MEHNGAIALYLLPLLAGVICALAGWATHSLRRIVRMNDEEHTRLNRQASVNAIEIARIETRLEMRAKEGGSHGQDQ